MEYSLGFSGRFQINTWTPLTVFIENRGRSLKGRCEVVVTSGSEYRRDVRQTVYSMDVELPYSSKKRCAFTIRIDSYSHDVVIRLLQENRIIVSHALNLRLHYTEKRLALVAGDRDSQDLLSVFPEDILPVTAPAGLLPETWYGYDGADILILDPETLKHLRDHQFHALTQWLNRGGFLFVAGGVNTGSLMDARTRSLLPIRLSGHKRLRELRSMESFCGHALTGVEPFLVIDAGIENSSVLIKEPINEPINKPMNKKDLPILTQKTIGRGRMLFLAFDIQHPQFSRWDKRGAFWKQILLLKPAPGENDIELENSAIMEFMSSTIPAGFPDYKFTFGFLIVYLLVLRSFLKQLGLRREKRRRTCLFLLISIGAFSMASHMIFLYPNTQKKLIFNSFSHIKPTGRHGIASGKKLIGLYSLGSGEYTLNLGERPHPVTRLWSGRRTAANTGDLRIHQDPSGRQISWLCAKWSKYFFMIRPGADIDIYAGAHSDDGSLDIAVENSTSFPLTNCLLFYDGRFFRMENVPADTEMRKRITPRGMKRTARSDGKDPGAILQWTGAPNAAAGNKLLSALLSAISRKYEKRRDVVFFAGWTSSGIIPAVFHPHPVPGTDLTLITLEIPIRKGQ